MVYIPVSKRKKEQTKTLYTPVAERQQQIKQIEQPQSVWREGVTTPKKTPFTDLLPMSMMSLSKKETPQKPSLLKSAVSGITNLGNMATNEIIDWLQINKQKLEKSIFDRDLEAELYKRYLQKEKLSPQGEKIAKEYDKKQKEYLMNAAIGATEPMKIGSSLIKKLTTVASKERAFKLLKEANVADDIAREYAPIVAKTTKEPAMFDVIKAIEKAQNTTKATGNIAKNDIMLSMAKNTDNPLLQEARKYKTAEDFVKAVNTVNPSEKGVFQKYTPELRNKMPIGDNIQTLDKSIGGKPDDIITVYRGTSGNKINAGDFITTNKQLAKDYAGTGNIVELKVRKGDIIDTIDESGMEEYVYKPNADKLNPQTKSQLTDIWNKANKKTAVSVSQITEKTEPKKIISQIETKISPSKSNISLPKIAAKTELSELPKLPKLVVKQDIQIVDLEKQAENIVDFSGKNIDTSLDNIIEQMPTPVNKKVNIVDYVRTPEKVLQKIGLGKEMNALRDGYDKYIKELPENISKIDEWIKQAPSKESNQKIFLYLDGQNVKLTPQESKVVSEIQTWLKEWADRLGLPEDKRITNYITHLFDEQLLKKEFDEDLAKIIAQKIPGSVYDPFLLKRLGKQGYKIDTWAALDAYVKRATRKVNLDPALKQIEAVEPSLEKSQWDYVKQFIDRVNLRPTDFDSLVDNAIKSTKIGYKFGARPSAVLTRTARQMGYRGGLGLNLGSAMRNLSQGINTYATLGEKYTAIGYSKLFSKANQQELIREGILEQGFIQDKTISATKKAIQKFDKVLFSLFEGVERINRGSAYFGAKAKALNIGKSEEEAIKYAKSIVRKTQFTFGSIDTPVALSSDWVKFLAQFQTYGTKQIEFLSELAKDKNFGALSRYTVLGMLYIATIGKVFGMDYEELIPSLRMPSPPAGKFIWEVVKAITNSPDIYGNQRDIQKKASDIGKTIWGIVPAGAQIKKTYQGLQSIEQGGSYDKAGRLQFKQDQSLSGQLQSLLFGKYSSQNAQDYFSGNKKSTTSTGLPSLKKVNKQKLPKLPKLPSLSK